MKFNLKNRPRPKYAEEVTPEMSIIDAYHEMKEWFEGFENELRGFPESKCDHSSCSLHFSEGHKRAMGEAFKECPVIKEILGEGST